VTPADADAVAHVFVDALADRCVVGAEDGHHLQRVRRVGVGERVTAADDRGAWRTYEVVETSRARLVLDACDDTHTVEEPAVAIALALGIPKTGLDGVVASATELGVGRITLVHTERTVVRWDGEKAARAIARLTTIAREAAMQSRRARLPVVDGLATLDAVATRDAVVVAERTGKRAYDLEPPARGEWTVVVGPEGGLSSGERARCAQHPNVALGSNVLRATTAPIAACAILADRIAQNRRG
jgi:16S rRNA (uracil1498-N3)-methyltransferase